MQPLTAPGRPPAARGRWIWRLSGVLTLVALVGLAAVAVTARASGPAEHLTMSGFPNRAVTITAPVTALNVESYGAPIKVSTGASGPVRVTESVTFDPKAGGAPPVTAAAARGLLTLAAPACNQGDCSVAFTVTVPPGVTVTATGDGGAVTVTGTGAATIDSGGGPVSASGINGPLTVSAGGGSITVNNTTAGAVLASGGGPVTASGVSGPLTVHADGGEIIAAGAPAADLDSGGGPVSAT